MIAVEREDALLCSPGKIAFGPINLWIWCAWKWTRVSWSSEERLGSVWGSVCCNWEVLIESSLLFDCCPNPEANFRTHGFEFPMDWTTAARCRHSTSEASSNIQCLAWVESSKSILFIRLYLLSLHSTKRIIRESKNENGTGGSFLFVARTQWSLPKKMFRMFNVANQSIQSVPEGVIFSQQFRLLNGEFSLPFVCDPCCEYVYTLWTASTSTRTVAAYRWLHLRRRRRGLNVFALFVLVWTTAQSTLKII